MAAYSPDEKQKIISYVLEQLAQGRALSRILQDYDWLCHIATWLNWENADPDLLEKVVRARETGVQILLDETIEIADDAVSQRDVYIEYDKDGRPYAKVDGDVIQRAKLRVHARHQYAQMVAPRTAKVDLTSGGKALPAPQTNVALVDARIQSLVHLAMERRDKGLVVGGPSVDELME